MCPSSHSTLQARCIPESEVLVVSQALNLRLPRWLSDKDRARRLAGVRASATVERLERRGLHAHGQIGDGDPLQAIADVLPSSPPTRW